MALRIGLLMSSALQNDGLDAPVISAELLRRPNLRAIGGPNPPTQREGVWEIIKLICI